MKLLFLDKHGHPLTKEEWRSLIRQPHYVRLHKSPAQDRVVETTWLGVAADYEAKPGIFVTRVLVHAPKGARKFKDVAPPLFTDSETAATRRHWELVNEYGGVVQS